MGGVPRTAFAEANLSWASFLRSLRDLDDAGSVVGVGFSKISKARPQPRERAGLRA